MSPPVVEARTRQVVVVFGGGGDASLAGVLASLVSGGQTELAGIFLEDHSLFRIAELPFALEVSRLTTSRRPITTVELEREMRVVATRAESLLRNVAERAGMRWSFRKLRGRLGAALEGIRDVDFVLVGAGRAMASASELGATARTLGAAEREGRRPIAVAFDASPTGNRALEAGIQLAKTTGRRLVVFRPASVALPELQSGLESLAAGRVVLETLIDEDPSALLRAVRRAAPIVLLVGADEAGFDEAALDRLRHELRCPMLVAH